MFYRRRIYFSEGDDPSFSGTTEHSVHAGFDVLTHRTDTFICRTIRTGRLTDVTSQKRAAETVSQILGLFHTGTRVLAAGIGNPNVTPDSLGPRCIGKLTPSPDTSPALFTVTPDIPARTGMNTADVVKAAVGIADADCIITVDALAAGSEESLASVIQITDRGTTPGSGTGAPSDMICTETMGIPVISIGVPTVIESGNLLVTPSDCDEIVLSFARVIAWGILHALFR